jgi:hypothetical protein
MAPISSCAKQTESQPMPLEIKRFVKIHPLGASVLSPVLLPAYQLSTKYNSRWFAKFDELDSFPYLFLRKVNGFP